MKIAQVAPVWTSVPPKGYGGAEKIISLLTEGLVERGYQVTLFASGDSITKANLIAVNDVSPGLNKEAQLSFVNNMQHLYNMFLALEKSEEFDLIHWHLSKDIAPVMFAPLTKKTSLITIHNHFYVEEEMSQLGKIFEHYKKFKNFVSISNYHRRYFPFEFLATNYNGINLEEFDYNENPQDYLVWMGRFEYQKGAHLAIDIAKKLNMHLKLAAPKDENDYFKEQIEPHLNDNLIEYMGEVNKVQRNDLLKNAKVFVNPIQWDEPFGLVVPESNACGTPVVAFNRGAMSEIIKDNINGFVIKSNMVEDFMNSVEKIFRMPKDDYLLMRQNCRRHVEQNFTSDKMIDQYEKIYQEILKERKME